MLTCLQASELYSTESYQQATCQGGRSGSLRVECGDEEVISRGPADKRAGKIMSCPLVITT